MSRARARVHAQTLSLSPPQSVISLYSANNKCKVALNIALLLVFLFNYSSFANVPDCLIEYVEFEFAF